MLHEVSETVGITTMVQRETPRYTRSASFLLCTLSRKHQKPLHLATMLTRQTSILSTLVQQTAHMKALLVLMLLALLATTVIAQAYDTDFDTFDDLFDEEEAQNVLSTTANTLEENFNNANLMTFEDCEKRKGLFIYKCMEKYLIASNRRTFCLGRLVQQSKCAFNKCPPSGISGEYPYLNKNKLVCEYNRIACPTHGSFKQATGKCHGQGITSCDKKYEKSNDDLTCIRPADRVCPPDATKDKHGLCKDAKMKLVDKLAVCTAGETLIPARYYADKCTIPATMVKCYYDYTLKNNECTKPAQCVPGTDCTRVVPIQWHEK